MSKSDYFREMKIGKSAMPTVYEIRRVGKGYRSVITQSEALTRLRAEYPRMQAAKGIMVTKEAIGRDTEIVEPLKRGMGWVCANGDVIYASHWSVQCRGK